MYLYMDEVDIMIDPKDYSSLAEALKALEAANAQIEKLERKTSQSGKNYLELVKNSIDSIFLVDIETSKIMYTNKYAAQRFGYTVDELVGKNITDIAVMNEPSLDTDSANIWLSRVSGALVSEGHYRHKDGHLIPVEVSTRFVEVNGRDLTQNFVRNISVQKAKEEKNLRQALEKERVNLLTNFIQHTGHEFRTPLSIINNNAYLMTKLDDEEKRASRAEAITKQVNHITELVDMLQLLTKVENLQIVPDEMVDIPEMLLYLTQEMRSSYGDQPKLVVDISALVTEIPAKKGYLKIAIQQLLSNAYRFTPKNGTIHISAEIINKELIIEVSDNGPGIAADVLSHIFETFWRQDEAHTTSGFGLGLSIALRIIEQHSGKIFVESEPGQGARFRIVLPL